MSSPKDLYPTVLVILDGFGHRETKAGNAIAQASMPHLTSLKNQYPWTLLNASGSAVGLLPDSIGNSEVGHLTIGAGRVIESPLVKMHNAITHHKLFENSMLKNHFHMLKQQHKTLHLIGLLSDGGVHSHEYHLYGLLLMAKICNLEKVIIHPFLDGRDVAPQSAADYLTRLENFLLQINLGSIGSIHGRFYAMDRDNNHERTAQSYRILTQPSTTISTSWQQALKASYEQQISDEFFVPCLIDDQGIINAGDGVLFFNFRPDRARQLTKLFLTDNKVSFFITLTRYDQSFTNDIIIEQEPIQHTLLDEIAHQSPHKKMFIFAETEKYAHVTYFFKGMREEAYPQEKRFLIPSLKEKQYVHLPEMSAQAITNQVMTTLTHQQDAFYLINYANADMVGHSGNLEATIKACEFLDQQLAQLYETVVKKYQGTLLITADHGNAEEKIAPDGTAKTAHTNNQVLFLAISDKALPFLPQNKAGLSIIAPYILSTLGLKTPAAMNTIK